LHEPCFSLFLFYGSYGPFVISINYSLLLVRDFCYITFQEMQFKNIALALTAISSVSAFNATNGSNGTNSTSVIPDNGAAGISTGALGVAAAAAAGVALLF
jgi:hypothetical protein